MVKEKVRIKLRAYDHRILDQSVQEIVSTVKMTGARVVGPIPLPTETKRYTVNRSSFVYKDSREQFEVRIHKRIIDVLNPSQRVIEIFSSLDLPSGVEVEIKTL